MGLYVPTGGGAYKDCGVSSTYNLPYVGDPDDGDGTGGWGLSSERMENYAYGVSKGRYGGNCGWGDE